MTACQLAAAVLAPQLKRVGRDILETLLKHISPLSWEHINLTGIYTWDTELQMPDGYDETRPENHVFLAHSRFIAPRRGSRFLSDTSVCPSGYASSYLLEVRRGEWEVRDAQNIADILVDPEGSLERRNHWENTSRALLVGAILHVLYADRTRPGGVVAFLSDPKRPIELTMAAMMTTPHLGEDGPHPVIASAGRPR